ncbi:hypothetical protein AK812_SmicGene45641, partial [Symbiodinium microadriaticum]
MSLKHIDSERGPDLQVRVIMAFKALSKVIALTGGARLEEGPKQAKRTVFIIIL